MSRSLTMAASVCLVFLVSPGRAEEPQQAPDPGGADVRLAALPEGVEVATRLFPRTPFGGFERRSSLVWSADGTRVAYVGTRDGAKFPVVGEEIGEAFDLVFRPEIAGGRVFFHVANQDSRSTQKHWVLIDGVKLPKEDWIGEMSVRPEGDRVAYWTHPGARYGNEEQAKKHKKYLVVATLRKSGKWKASRGDEYRTAPMSAPLWTGNGEHVVTCGMTRKGWVGVRVGKRERVITEPCGRIAEFDVSSDGASLAYVATDMNGEKPELYFQGERLHAAHHFVALPTVDPSGDRVAAVVGTKDGVTVAVNGEVTPAGAYGHVTEMAFSPDGSRLAFVAVNGGVESEREPGYIEGGKWFVVIRPTSGGAEEEAFEVEAEHARVRDLVWSVDASRVAYAAFGDSWRIVCGSAVSDEFADVGRPHFLPDGNVGHGARIGRELWWKVLPVD